MFYDKPIDSNILHEEFFKDPNSNLILAVLPKDSGSIPHAHVFIDNIKSGNDICINLTDNSYFDHGKHKGTLKAIYFDKLNEFLSSNIPKRIQKYLRQQGVIKCDTIYDALRGEWNIAPRAHYISYNLDQPIYTNNMPTYNEYKKQHKNGFNVIDKQELKNELNEFAMIEFK